MKIKLTIIGLLLAAGLFTIQPFTTNAIAERPEPHAVVFLGFDATFGPVVYVDGGGYHPQTGLKVAWVNRSQSAPEITQGSSLAESMALLMNAGFKLEIVSNGSILFTK